MCLIFKEGHSASVGTLLLRCLAWALPGILAHCLDEACLAASANLPTLKDPVVLSVDGGGLGKSIPGKGSVCRGHGGRRQHGRRVWRGFLQRQQRGRGLGVGERLGHPEGRLQRPPGSRPRDLGFVPGAVGEQRGFQLGASWR